LFILYINLCKDVSIRRRYYFTMKFKIIIVILHILSSTHFIKINNIKVLTYYRWCLNIFCTLRVKTVVSILFILKHNLNNKLNINFLKNLLNRKKFLELNRKKFFGYSFKKVLLFFFMFLLFCCFAFLSFFLCYFIVVVIFYFFVCCLIFILEVFPYSGEFFIIIYFYFCFVVSIM
jgi:hypothetical protein